LILHRNIAAAASFVMIAFVIPASLFYILMNDRDSNPKPDPATQTTQENQTPQYASQS
jgi:hypothetical protein